MAAAKSDDMARLLLRLGLGVIMLFHGAFKVTHGVAWMAGPLSAYSLPGFLAYGVYVAEVVAPILILIGYRSRLAALVVAFDMVMAVLLVMKQQIVVVKEMGGGWGIELEALLFVCSLALFFTGGGTYSLTRGRNKWD